MRVRSAKDGEELLAYDLRRWFVEVIGIDAFRHAEDCSTLARFVERTAFVSGLWNEKHEHHHPIITDNVRYIMAVFRFTVNSKSYNKHYMAINICVYSILLEGWCVPSEELGQWYQSRGPRGLKGAVKQLEGFLKDVVKLEGDVPGFDGTVIKDPVTKALFCWPMPRPRCIVGGPHGEARSGAS